jgi:pSer/pThr/pTyr-binding forkhead associated (FHA) protein
MEDHDKKTEFILPRRGGDDSAEQSYQEVLATTSQLNLQKLTQFPVNTSTAYLDVSGQSGATMTVNLDKPRTIIGSDPNCDVQIMADGISRQHAAVIRRGSDYILEDLDSTNGTYVNSVKIVSCVLRHNDAIHVGKGKVFFVEEQTRRF